MRGLLLGTSLVSVFAFGCEKEPPKQRALNDVNSASFWPDAPKPSSTSTAHAFAYDPDNITGYTMTMTGGMPASSATSGKSMDVTMALELAMKRGATPNIRDIYFRMFDVDVKMPGNDMKIRLDDTGMFVKQGTEPPVEIKRGDEGALDVGAMVDQAFATFEFTPENAVLYRPIETHPFATLAGAGANDMLDNAVMLFPDLPAGEIKPGHTWKSSRRTLLTPGTKVDVEYEFKYDGDGVCPSGAPSCALFTFTGGSAKDATVTGNGVTLKAGFGLAGKVYFDLARHAPDESRVRMRVEMKSGDLEFNVDATYVVKPMKS